MIEKEIIEGIEFHMEAGKEALEHTQRSNLSHEHFWEGWQHMGAAMKVVLENAGIEALIEKTTKELISELREKITYYRSQVTKLTNDKRRLKRDANFWHVLYCINRGSRIEISNEKYYRIYSPHDRREIAIFRSNIKRLKKTGVQFPEVEPIEQ